jgi:hypothetical protein
MFASRAVHLIPTGSAGSPVPHQRPRVEVINSHHTGIHPGTISSSQVLQHLRAMINIPQRGVTGSLRRLLAGRYPPCSREAIKRMGRIFLVQNCNIGPQVLPGMGRPIKIPLKQRRTNLSTQYSPQFQEGSISKEEVLGGDGNSLTGRRFGFPKSWDPQGNLRH